MADDYKHFGPQDDYAEGIPPRVQLSILNEIYEAYLDVVQRRRPYQDIYDLKRLLGEDWFHSADWDYANAAEEVFRGIAFDWGWTEVQLVPITAEKLRDRLAYDHSTFEQEGQILLTHDPLLCRTIAYCEIEADAVALALNLNPADLISDEQ